MKRFFQNIINTCMTFGSKYSRPLPNGKGRASGISRGLNQVDFEGNNKVASGCNFNGKISIGKYTTLGYNGTYHGSISIGKYCQFGPQVSIITSNHPMHHLSTYINENLFSGELKKLKEDKPTQIGNDVWVGQNVIILGGVRIGDGAILAAGAVVTKDVDDFTIVAGSPAKRLKYRFEPSVREEIKALAWWNKSVAELEEIKPLFLKNLSDKNSIYS